MPIMERFGVPATARASFAFYNDYGDVDQLIAGLTRAVEIFRG
jgi:cysteine desulfurase/selenocysteine lyase